MTRGPSAKMMQTHFRITSKDARAIKEVMDSGKIEATMKKANELMQGHGIEHIESEFIWINSYWRNVGLLYVNKGQTYAITLCYDTEKRYFFIGSWGDWVERTHWFKHTRR